jgi:hypothetical protein
MMMCSRCGAPCPEEAILEGFGVRKIMKERNDLRADRDAAIARATKAEERAERAEADAAAMREALRRALNWMGAVAMRSGGDDLNMRDVRYVAEVLDSSDAGRRLLAEREAMLKCVEAARDMSREYARLDSGEDIPLSDEFAFDNAWERVRDALAALDKQAKEGT